MRDEQLRIRGAPGAAVTGENVVHMTYTRQVVKEVLRYRPPAPMVPQVPLLTLQGWLQLYTAWLSLLISLDPSAGRLWQAIVARPKSAV